VRSEIGCTADNRLNGTYCSENKWLLNDVLRREWGFLGLVVSDWGGTNLRAAGVRHGCDLEMPGTAGLHDGQLRRAVQLGWLSTEMLDKVCVRIVALILASSQSRISSQLNAKQSPNFVEHVSPEVLSVRDGRLASISIDNVANELPPDCTVRGSEFSAGPAEKSFANGGQPKINFNEVIMYQLNAGLGSVTLKNESLLRTALQVDAGGVLGVPPRAAAPANIVDESRLRNHKLFHSLLNYISPQAYVYKMFMRDFNGDGVDVYRFIRVYGQIPTPPRALRSREDIWTRMTMDVMIVLQKLEFLTCSNRQ